MLLLGHFLRGHPKAGVPGNKCILALAVTPHWGVCWGHNPLFREELPVCRGVQQKPSSAGSETLSPKSLQIGFKAEATGVCETAHVDGRGHHSTHHPSSVWTVPSLPAQGPPSGGHIHTPLRAAPGSLATPPRFPPLHLGLCPKVPVPEASGVSLPDQPSFLLQKDIQTGRGWGRVVLEEVKKEVSCR